MTATDWTDRIDGVHLPAGPLPPMALGPDNLLAVRDSLDTRRAGQVRELGHGDVRIEDLLLDVGGRGVAVRRYATAPGQAAALLYCHSGGYLLGNLDIDHARAVDLVRLSGVTLLSVDYRLAPEHPYPAGLDDCVDVLMALVADPAEFGLDGRRWAVGGSSAGAGLAAAVALRVRDERPDLSLALQLLHQPMLDRTCGTPSMREFETTPYFDAVSARYAWAAYTGATDPTVAPYLSPADAVDLDGLPPAFVTCSEVDPLRDEAIAYATRLVRAGVPTELHLYPRTCHGFDSVSPLAPVSLRTIREQADALGRALG